VKIKERVRKKNENLILKPFKSVGLIFKAITGAGIPLEKSLLLLSLIRVQFKAYGPNQMSASHSPLNPGQCRISSL